VQGGADLVLYQGARDTAHARSLLKGSISSTFPLQDEGRWLLSQPSVLRSLNKRGLLCSGPCEGLHILLPESQLPSTMRAGNTV
jgi:hypothetical protein